MMSNLEKKLHNLVISGTIKNYSIYNVSDDGKVGVWSEKGRNREFLNIVFNNDEEITLGTFCSGCCENTILTLEEAI